MKKITVESILDKMVLAKDVCGPSGNVLLGSGTRLSTSLGRRLKNWGINFVVIEGADESPARENAQRVSPEEIGKSLQEKFSWVLGDPSMKKIFMAVQEYKIQKGAM